jgi:hypothetical protein
MLKKFRKYQRVMMVGFGVLLLLTWLAGPAIERIGRAAGNRTVGKIDGQAVRALDQQLAYKELTGLMEVVRRTGLSYFDPVGGDRDALHWMLLVHEAQAGGYIAEAESGPRMMERLAPALAMEMVQTAIDRQDFNLYLAWANLKTDQERQNFLDNLAEAMKRAVSQALSEKLNSHEAEMTLAKLFGVRRMQQAYYNAAQMSDRAAVAEGRRQADGAVVDYVVVPATSLAAKVPEPDEAALEAQFQALKGVRPGEGEHGIGYLLGPRVKFEFLELDRQAIDQAVVLDPVEVRKRWSQDRAKYKGEFAAERAAVEADIRRETTDRIMAEATSAYQREVQKLTRRLESDGKYRLLPADWDPAQPRLEAVARAMVDQVKSVMGLTMPLPRVEVRGSAWSEERDLMAIPGIGQSSLNQGGLRAGFPQVVFWAKELGSGGPIAVQAGVPLAENFLEDGLRNRYFFSILAVRPESPPDSVAEIRERVLDDYRKLRGYELLLQQEPQLRQAAASEDGLDRLATEYGPGPDASNPARPAGLEVRRGLRVTGAPTRDAALTDDVRKAIVEAARAIDPLTPPGQVPPEMAAVVAPAPKALSVVIARIQQPAPLTIEEYRAMDQQFVANARMAELVEAGARDAFTLASLLKRHIYMQGDKRIASEADLRRDDQEG